MDRDVGFYDPAEKSGSSEKSGSIDFDEIFVLITNKTGWSPEQISKLTLKQIKTYLRVWISSVDKEESINPDFEAIQAFNLSAGIERVPKKIN